MERGLSSEPGGFFDDVLQEDQASVQSALDLLQEMEDLLIVCTNREMREGGRGGGERVREREGVRDRGRGRG